ncbi:SDR family oxidoreductase (plasmid) [Pseudonocardia bannensis]|uniref:SDR family oxidoreductase n=1 Tax=Pseudonocardia TaxID=1847 RepID=UPI001B7CE8E7|nr:MULTISPECIES: SDR family oxidoreductase [Pseudonocardia]
MSGSERLRGQVALVSGGANGIGRAVVERFLAEGACVGVLDRQPDALHDLRAEWSDRLVVVGGDVRDAAAHEAVLDATSQSFGPVDTYVANAGIHDMWTRLEDIPTDQLPAAFHELFTVDVLGYLLGARRMASALRAARGSMIFTASSSSRYAGGGGALYVAAKHAVVGLVRQLAHELAPDVRVNAIAPGATATGLSGLSDSEVGRGRLDERPGLMDRVAETVPLGFVAEPADHAALYVLLASATEAPFVTGAVLPSDGGLDVRRSGRHHRRQRMSGASAAAQT